MTPETAMYKTMEGLGFDMEDPNFIGTPFRVTDMWRTFLKREHIEYTTFPLRTKSGMIVFRNHETWGFCPHHLLPIKYTVHMCYLPEDNIVLGLSKPLRMVDEIIKQLPLQEELPGLIVEKLVENTKPKGAGCIVFGEHLCTRIRGVKSPCAEAVTDCMNGVLLEVHQAREEFLLLCNMKQNQ